MGTEDDRKKLGKIPRNDPNISRDIPEDSAFRKDNLIDNVVGLFRAAGEIRSTPTRSHWFVAS